MHKCIFHHLSVADSLSKLVIRVLLSLVPESDPKSIGNHVGTVDRINPYNADEASALSLEQVWVCEEMFCFFPAYMKDKDEASALSLEQFWVCEEMFCFFLAHMKDKGVLSYT
nr:hypothetical protein [Tanacetum cinerariifolium]